MCQIDFLFCFWTVRGVGGILTRKKGNSKVLCNIILRTTVEMWPGEPASQEGNNEVFSDTSRCTFHSRISNPNQTPEVIAPLEV